MIERVSVSLALLALAGVPAAAQSLPAELPVLRAGQSIRLIPLDPGRADITGRLLDWTPGSITLTQPLSVRPIRYPLSEIGLVEVSVGRNEAIAWSGTAAGVGVGALLGPVILQEEERCATLPPDHPDCVWETSQLAIGAVVGGIVFGIATRWVAAPERWVEIPLTWFEIAASPRGVTLGLRFSAP